MVGCDLKDFLFELIGFVWCFELYIMVKNVNYGEDFVLYLVDMGWL